jgi:hypothetical protein
MGCMQFGASGHRNSSPCREYAKAGCAAYLFPRSRRIVRRLRSHRAGDGANRTTSASEWLEELHECASYQFTEDDRGLWVGDPDSDMGKIGPQGCANREVGRMSVLLHKSSDQAPRGRAMLYKEKGRT